MTKKEAYEIIEKKYGAIEYNGYVSALCLALPCEMKYDFRRHWSKVKGDPFFVSDYLSLGKTPSNVLGFGDCKAIVSLTRLLTLHMFIEDYYD